ncbi:MAG: hypothetical protein JRN23_06600 [Nitrososphaerota archaeon]|jgi:hypothetical protein|nr:hypothetical protein [Nitrososphaerota archaeon]MDG6966790.1 hypothetical protein [Nitrososphaerota archaeon]MDG6977950.1 hypothetical protein [Nitrososphaerota archaeon]MDG7021584.1 hypothetical protein [Nitrososphaerota archaeon]
MKRIFLASAVGVMAILMAFSLVVVPAHGQEVPPLQKVKNELPTAPVWATVNAAAQGNYPGGNEIFNVFTVDSALPPETNVTVLNETLTTTAWSGFNSNFAIGLPVTLQPGNSILNTIALQIPSNFTQSNFTANLKAYVNVLNGTNEVGLVLTGNVVVYMLGLPLTGPSTVTMTTTSVSTVSQSTGVSTAALAAGAGIPSVVAIALLALLVRGRRKT